MTVSPREEWRAAETRAGGRGLNFFMGTPREYLSEEGILGPKWHNAALPYDNLGRLYFTDEKPEPKGGAQPGASVIVTELECG